MAKFQPRAVQFGRGKVETEDGQDNGEGLPTAKLLKIKARRAEGIRECKEVLKYLPEPNESLHAVVTARMDLSDVIQGLLEKVGPCVNVTIATLGFNARNLNAFRHWIETGSIRRINLIASDFFRAHQKALWSETQEFFREYGHRCACCYSHAKVCTLEFECGKKFAIEGSANLCGNGSGREQFMLVNSEELHDWHRKWILELLEKYEGKEK